MSSSGAQHLPVADRWFEVVPIDDALTLIREPHVASFVRGNIWYLRGERLDLVIDTGLGVASLSAELAAGFSRRPPVAVVTHAHLDHLGSAHEFAEVWAHELEPTELPGQGTLLGEELNEILGGHGCSIGVPNGLLVEALPHPDYVPADYALVPVEPTRRLVDGEVIDLGDRRLTVVHLPGHTAGSIGLYDRDNRALFTGDVVYDPPDLLDELVHSNVDDYVRSMRRLLTLDVSIVYPGHGDPFAGERLRDIAGAYVARRAAG
ncbi:MBL fold metallo-hydrolase [Millisia brevis]|uniref:MBL fold metallo-hydrolase n=1 Tax=Millisia brevis TaxID=264148 RepID=UPI000829B7C0|nr:MBL fold metallo-hydrolase [Millisia brevis]